MHHKTAKCSVRASIVKTTYLFPPAVIYLVFDSVLRPPHTSRHLHLKLEVKRAARLQYSTEKETMTSELDTDEVRHSMKGGAGVRVGCKAARSVHHGKAAYTECRK